MSGTTKSGGRNYLAEARIAAGYSNRESAAIAVPYSATMIGRHERSECRLGTDDLLMYARAYNAPELMMYYCRSECPIGRRMLHHAGKDKGIAQLAVQLSNRLRGLADVADKLAGIADDDYVSADERPEFDSAIEYLRQLRDVTDELELYALIKRPARSGAGGSSRAGCNGDCISTIAR